MLNPNVLKLSKRLLTFTVILLVFLIALIAIGIPLSRQLNPQDFPQVGESDSRVIDNINLVTMTDNGLMTNRQLVIENRLITAIHPAGTNISPSRKVIDAKGAYLTPGLFDMHVHLYDPKYLVANLAYGVTSVRALRGETRFLQWREQINTGQWLGSNLYVSSPILDGEHAHALNQKTLTPADGRYQVRLAKEKGYDLVKTYGYLDADVFSAIIDEAAIQNIAVAKHGPHPIGENSWSSLSNLQSLEHVEDIFQGPLNFKFDEDKLKPVIAQLKSLGVPVTPTLHTFHHLTRLSVEKQNFINTLDLDYLNSFYRDLLKHFSVDRWLNASDKHGQYNQKEFKFLQTIVKALNAAEVPLLVGSDAGTMFTLPGLSTHKEMALLKASGLSDFQVLQAATVNPARALGVESQYGQIKIGAVADLVMVRENPLKDIRHLRQPVAVVKNGQWLNQTDLAKLQLSAKNTENYFFSLMAFLDDLIERNFFE